MIGVYEIRNTVTGKAYIGASVDVKSRWRYHRWRLKHESHANTDLQTDWTTYGEESFSFSVLIEGVERKDLGQLEQDYIDNRRNLYNVSEEMFDFTRRRSHSEETKSKLRSAAEGRMHTEESKARMSNAQKGRKHSEETRKKIADANRGRIYSDETRKKIADANRHRIHSDETKGKIAAANKGRFTGEKAPLAKLTWEKVREIRRLYAEGGISQTKLGSQFQVGPSTIYKIVNNQTWIEK